MYLIFTWQVTARVKQSWVFPVRNSPKILVMLPVSIPPPSNLSSSFDPVVTWTRSAVCTPLMTLCGCSETHSWHQLSAFSLHHCQSRIIATHVLQKYSNLYLDTYQYFICLYFIYSFDGNKILSWSINHWFYCVKSSSLKLLNISHTDSMTLKKWNCRIKGKLEKKMFKNNVTLKIGMAIIAKLYRSYF